MMCGDVCTDVSSSPIACGSCDTKCKTGQECDGSECIWPCVGGTEACDDGCHDLQNDPLNCGTCGNVCGAGQNDSDTGSANLWACDNGTCVKNCEDNQLLCGDVCVNTLNDNQNCGQCGEVCDLNDLELCENGSCVKHCPADEEMCGNECFNLDESIEHCGSCGNSCDADNENCVDGECTPKCPISGQTECQDGCFDLTKDKLHCGTCVNECGPDEVCGAGECLQGCPNEGEVACNGGCIDPLTDTEYCGASGKCEGNAQGEQCTDGKVCLDGACGCPQEASRWCAVAEGEYMCVDADGDAKHCGCGISDGGREDETVLGVDCSLLPNTNGESGCASGECVITADKCSSGYGHCDDDILNGCETDITTVDNCGACGNACSVENAKSTACVQGVCKPECEEGFIDCAGRCVHLDTVENCSYCGNICGAGQVCSDEGFCQTDEDVKCDTNGYLKYTVTIRKKDNTTDTKEVNAYCLTNDKWSAFRTAINNGMAYPNDNADNAYILMDDISITGSSYKPVGSVDRPFVGYFIGNGHIVAGTLKTVGSFAGLFGNVGDAEQEGSLLDGLNLYVNLEGVLDTSADDHFENVGALAGKVTNTLVQRTKINGTVTGDANTGGLIGYAYESIVRMIDAETTVTGMRRSVGGIVGWALGAAISGLTANSKVYHNNGVRIYEKSGNTYVYKRTEPYYMEYTGYFQDWGYGGVVGRLANSTLQNCTMRGEVNNTGENAKGGMHGSGGLIGVVINSKISDSHTYNVNVSAAGDGATCGGFVGINDYYTTDNVPYTEYKNCSSNGGTVQVYWQAGGFASHMKSGLIENCTSSTTVQNYTHDSGGLVGYIPNYADADGNVLGSVTIKNSSATGEVNPNHDGTHPDNGGLVGRAYNATIDGCFATGNVKTPNTGGGLVGAAINVTINNSYATGNVTEYRTDTKDRYVDRYGDDIKGAFGGLVGYMKGGSISKSWAGGTIKGRESVGGLVGIMDSASVTDSFARGTSTATGNYAGGLIGRIMTKSTIQNCASIGNAGGSGAGSLAGVIQPGIHKISVFYGTGSISGASNAGALIGLVQSGSPSPISLKHSYYWSSGTSKGNAVGSNATGQELSTIPFTYANYEAKLSDGTKTLVDALNSAPGGSGWISRRCTLSTGPGTSQKGPYDIPVLQVLGNGICQ